MMVIFLEKQNKKKIEERIPVATAIAPEAYEKLVRLQHLARYETIAATTRAILEQAIEYTVVEKEEVRETRPINKQAAELLAGIHE